jgi:regulator of protease activity HflC (stomatin/prohibitin superfamily)
MADISSFKVPGGARGRPAQVLILSVGIVIFAMIFMGSCTTYIHPNEVGILESRLVGTTGIRPGVLDGGKIHFLMPGQTIHTFPSNLQILQLSNDENDQIAGERNEPSLEVNTSDGSKVRVDVTVLYHIDNPYTVMQQSGAGNLYITNALLPKTVAALKKNLGEMLAEDFYDVHKRTEKTKAAQDQISSELKDKGISIDHVMLRQYYYNPAYEQQIDDKKIQDQLVFTNQAKGDAAKEKAKLQEIQATGQANVAVENQRGTAEVTKIQAEADNYKRKRQAEADLLVQLATAKGTELENAAYQGGGSENLVGMKMADVLSGLDTIIVPVGGKGGMNPLDLDQSLKMFDVRQP